MPFYQELKEQKKEEGNRIEREKMRENEKKTKMEGIKGAQAWD